MKLTKLERRILINQLEILKHLDKEAQDYEERITILREGYSFRYEEAVGGVWDEVSESEYAFVLEVLSMFRMIEWYKEDSGDTLSGALFSHFAGFDRNYEGTLLRTAKFEIRRENNWDEQKKYEHKTDRFNSHCPLRPTYERMLAVFKTFPTERLTGDQVTAILAAAEAPRR